MISWSPTLAAEAVTPPIATATATTVWTIPAKLFGWRSAGQALWYTHAIERLVPKGFRYSWRRTTGVAPPDVISTPALCSESFTRLLQSSEPSPAA